jgi:hypothetical protein
MFKSLRVHQLFPTRKPKKRPAHIEIIEGKTPHGSPMRLIPTSDAPGVFVLPEFDPPGILLDREPTNLIKIVRHNVYATTIDARFRQKKLIGAGMKGALAYTQFEPIKFARVLAKIAHCFVIAAAGINRFSPLLVPIILGQDKNVSFYVGNGPYMVICGTSRG